MLCGLSVQAALVLDGNGIFSVSVFAGMRVGVVLFCRHARGCCLARPGARLSVGGQMYGLGPWTRACVHELVVVGVAYVLACVGYLVCGYLCVYVCWTVSRGVCSIVGFGA